MRTRGRNMKIVIISLLLACLILVLLGPEQETSPPTLTFSETRRLLLRSLWSVTRNLLLPVVLLVPLNPQHALQCALLSAAVFFFFWFASTREPSALDIVALATLTLIHGIKFTATLKVSGELGCLNTARTSKQLTCAVPLIVLTAYILYISVDRLIACCGHPTTRLREFIFMLFDAFWVLSHGVYAVKFTDGPCLVRSLTFSGVVYFLLITPHAVSSQIIHGSNAVAFVALFVVYTYDVSTSPRFTAKWTHRAFVQIVRLNCVLMILSCPAPIIGLQMLPPYKTLTDETMAAAQITETHKLVSGMYSFTSWLIAPALQLTELTAFDKKAYLTLSFDEAELLL